MNILYKGLAALFALTLATDAFCFVGQVERDNELRQAFHVDAKVINAIIDATPNHVVVTKLSKKRLTVMIEGTAQGQEALNQLSTSIQNEKNLFRDLKFLQTKSIQKLDQEFIQFSLRVDLSLPEKMLTPYRDLGCKTIPPKFDRNEGFVGAFSELNSILDSRGMAIDNFTPSAEVFFDEHSTISLELGITGNFEYLQEFFEDFQHAKGLLIPKNFSIVSSKNNMMELRLIVDMIFDFGKGIHEKQSEKDCEKRTTYKLKNIFEPTRVDQQLQLRISATEEKGALESSPIASMQFITAVGAGKNIQAIVLLDGRSYSIKLGQLLGQNTGRVTNITSEEITIRELFREAGKPELMRDTVLKRSK